MSEDEIQVSFHHSQRRTGAPRALIRSCLPVAVDRRRRDGLVVVSFTYANGIGRLCSSRACGTALWESLL